MSASIKVREINFFILSRNTAYDSVHVRDDIELCQNSIGIKYSIYRTDDDSVLRAIRYNFIAILFEKKIKAE